LKIKVYDIVKLKNNDFFLIRTITEERISGSIDKKLIANGFTIKDSDYNLAELQKMEKKKLIIKYESNNIEKIDLEKDIIAIISNKTKIEWRLNKKVPLI